MKIRIKILILEHNPNDIGLLRDELNKRDENYILRVVQTRKDYENVLSSFNPDIILANYSLPSFDGLAAFRIRQQMAPDTPFLIVSGTIGEENAVELIRMGVTDYVLKRKIYQITPKIHRALKEATERKQKEAAERQLRQREQQLQKIMDLSRDVICTLDQEGRFMTVGAACTSSWGYLPEALIGRRAIDLIRKEDRESTLQAIAELKNGVDMVNFENWLIRKDGTTVPLLWSAHWDSDEQLGYSVARDATEIKQAEEKIRNKEKRFRTLLQHSTDGFSLLTADGKVLERSPSSLKVLGNGTHEISGKLRLDLVHPDDLSAFQQVWTQVKHHPNAIHTVAYRVLLPDGAYKWLETTFHNQLHEPAVEAIVENYRDITESKIAEIALKRSEARLKEAQALGHIGYWETNWADGNTEWSDEMYCMLGVDKNDFRPESKTFISFIHPDDRLAVLSRLEKACACLKKDAMTFRILQPGGQVRYVSSQVHFELDEKGEPIRFFGIHQDVTERKLAEIALEKSEEKYRNLFTLSPTPMWVYEVNTLHFLDVNEAAITHYGYAKEEFLSLTLRDIQSQGEIGRAAEIAADLQRDLPPYHYLTKLVKKSGEVIDVDIKDSFIDLGGKQARLVIATDISERVKYIQAIKEQNVRLREIAWIQSHVVRAPLARMMGIVDLLQDYRPEQVGAGDLLGLLLASAHELDEIIREIVRKTEQVKAQSVPEQISTCADRQP